VDVPLGAEVDALARGAARSCVGRDAEEPLGLEEGARVVPEPRLEHEQHGRNLVGIRRPPRRRGARDLGQFDAELPVDVGPSVGQALVPRPLDVEHDVRHVRERRHLLAPRRRRWVLFEGRLSDGVALVVVVVVRGFEGLRRAQRHLLVGGVRRRPHRLLLRRLLIDVEARERLGHRALDRAEARERAVRRPAEFARGGLDGVARVVGVGARREGEADDNCRSALARGSLVEEANFEPREAALVDRGDLDRGQPRQRPVQHHLARRGHPPRYTLRSVTTQSIPRRLRRHGPLHATTRNERPPSSRGRQKTWSSAHAASLGVHWPVPVTSCTATAVAYFF